LLELEPQGAGDHAGLLAPPPPHLAQGCVAHLGRQQVRDHRSDVRPGLVRVRIAVEGDLHVADERATLRLPRRELLVDTLQRRSDLPRDPLRLRERRPLRQEDARLEDVAVDVREGGDLQGAARDQRSREEKHHHGQPHAQVPPAHDPVDRGPQDPVADPLDGRVEAAAEAAGSLRIDAVQRVLEMARQDQEGLDQADGEHHDQHDGQDAQDLAERPRDEGERPEDADRRRERGDHAVLDL
jgi:hypothetical protein